MAQLSQKAPSDLLRIDTYIQRKYNCDGWWVAIQVDHAVLTFGNRVESLLNEIDDKTKMQKYILDGLLKPAPTLPTKKQVTRIPRNHHLLAPKPKRKQNVVAGNG